MIRRPPRSTQSRSSAASDVYKRQLQEREVEGRPLYVRVAELVARLGADHRGDAGYSDVGAVAGATSPASLRLVREALPHAFLLVPGYGAQGAGADALAGVAAGDAAGFVVNASRSIIYAWQTEAAEYLSLIHISEPTRLGMISYAV